MDKFEGLKGEIKKQMKNNNTSNPITMTFEGASGAGKTYFLLKVRKYLEIEGFDTEVVFDGKEKLIVYNKFEGEKYHD